MESQSDQTGVGFDPAPVSFCTKTVTVVVRHSTNCKGRHRGGSWRKCRCPEALLMYEGTGFREESAGERQDPFLGRAEQQAQELLDSWDPEKVKLRSLLAEKEQRQGRLEEAVNSFLADQIARLGDNGTVRNSQSLFDYVNPETEDRHQGWRLVRWVEKYNADRPADQRIIYISDITSAHLTEWRPSRHGNSDVTN